MKIDWIKAAILERMDAMGLSRSDVCKLAHVCAPTFRRLMQTDAVAWDYDTRKRIFKALRLSVSDFPQEIQISIAKQI